ncbi:SafA/ExsA family spore coat assembly protein [Paraliobacillus ryukyuensis]|uniref:SafA/ExsA family spore coat assembly protein n=1 Tax=Paraliobacillus ryukyuensis TaxID=200904 RepID=UPI002118F3BE|nr:SafA/ExsA family spore coat assembly protein [Paraliobacillus ryukyuensis]
MKIHIVQKGDTLWNLAQKYGVDFEELKQMNAQLANPNMIMPGMKIKIPTSSKQVQTQPTKDKTMQPYKDMSPKAMPVINEDDSKPAPNIKKTMPKPTPVAPTPQMQPIQLPDLPNFYSTNYNIDVDYEDNDTEINQTTIQQMNETHKQAPIQQQPIQQAPQQQPMQVPMYHPPMMPMHPCMPCMPMHVMPPMMQPWQTMPQGDPCEKYSTPQAWMQQEPMPFQPNEELMESPSVEMPPLPPQMPMQQQSMPMPPNEYWQQPKQQMWSQAPQQPMMQAPMMGANGSSMQPNMMPPSAYQSMPTNAQPGMPMPYEGNMQPYPMQGAYPYREETDDE